MPEPVFQDHELALIRGLLLLSLVLALVSMVFRMGAALGYRAAADDMQWQLEAAKAKRERERADTT